MTSQRTRARLLRERLVRTARAASFDQLKGRVRRQRFRRWFRRLEGVPVEADTDPADLVGWVPIQVDLARGHVGWIPRERLAFRRGLFYETLFAALSSSPAVPARRTGLATLRALGAALPREREPKGFVLHVSRCGSTLLGNMLLASPRNLVVQEAEAINAVLRDFTGTRGDDEKAELLRGVTHAYARELPEDGRLYVKFSSWNVLQQALLRKAFPDVPSVFVTRDPVEVVVSNLLKPGTWVRDQTNPEMGVHLVGATSGETRSMSRSEYCARVVARYGRSALAHAEGTLFVDYAQLSEDCFRRVLEHFASPVSDEEFATMAQQMSFYSKGAATRGHSGDEQKKQELAGEDVADEVTRHAGEVFAELRRRRLEL